METRFVQEMYRFISKHTLIEDGESVLVAVSGGADSLALLYGLHSLHTHLNFHLQVVHLNHGLRQDSASDADFVQEHAKMLGMPFIGHTVDLHCLNTQWKLSVEAAGRKARYEFYESVCTQTGATKVALGHHQDDSAETVLMNLIRGAGSTGLKGIEPIRDGKFIRPLLTFNRPEIETYLASIDVVPRHDATNKDTHFLRNRIRHELIPFLEERYNPNIKSGLIRTAEIIGAESKFLDEMTREAYNVCKLDVSQNKDIKLDRTKFLHHHIVLQRRIIRYCIMEITNQVSDFTYDHCQAILNIINGDKPNAEITLPNGLHFKRAYQILILENTPIDMEHFACQLNVPGKTYIPELDVEIQADLYNIPQGDISTLPDGTYEAMFDYSAIQLPLTVRNRQEGDRFQPYGMEGTKKIKNYLMDAKIPLIERDSIPILISGNDIIWVIGFTTHEKYKVHHQTQNVLHLFYGNRKINSKFCPNF